jgi:hypothetical protein
MLAFFDLVIIFASLLKDYSIHTGSCKEPLHIGPAPMQALHFFVLSKVEYGKDVFAVRLA